MRLLISLFAVALAHLSHPAIAFEVDGYRSGMSLSEVTAVGRRSGWDVASISFLGSLGDGSYIQQRQLPSGGVEYGRDISFCNHRLMSLGENIKGGFDAFVATVEAFTSRFGKGNLASRSEAGQKGVSSTVTVEWSDRDNDRHRVSMSNFHGHQIVSVTVLSRQIAASCNPTH